MPTENCDLAKSTKIRFDALSDKTNALTGKIDALSNDFSSIKSKIYGVKIAFAILTAIGLLGGIGSHISINQTNNRLDSFKKEINAATNEGILKIDTYTRKSLAWKSFDIPLKIGTLPFDTKNTITHKIPEEIPDSAKEILVFVQLYSGRIPKVSELAKFNIYTSDSNTKYIQTISWYQFDNNAIAFNSSTIWLPLTKERKLHSQLIGTPRPEMHIVGGGGIEILGYR